MRVFVRRRRFWWVACNPDEVLGEIDFPTYFRAFSQERAIEKCVRRFAPKPSPWEEIIVTVGEPKP